MMFDTMKNALRWTWMAAIACGFFFAQAVHAFSPLSDGEHRMAGELMRWHAATLEVGAVSTDELASPNPFMDYRMNVTFEGPSGQVYVVPGYFAGDGEGGAAGNVWRAHLNPDETGDWSYTVSFRSGTAVAVNLNAAAGSALAPYDGLSGSFTITPSDKTGDDFRAPDKGMLVNRGDHYLTFGGSGKPFLYTGPGIPENFLGYRGFTNTNIGVGHEFTVHEADWNPGDPDWGNQDGRAIIGAVNYIAEQGGNALYIMSNTLGGDGKDVFMHPSTDAKERYDILKLDQWDTVLSHAQSKGIFLHLHLAEHESGNQNFFGAADSAMRQLYFRMLAARFGHYNGLKWNLMEESEWSPQEHRVQAAYMKAVDPYNHPLTYQAGGAGQPFSTYDNHLGEPEFDAGSFQGSQSNDSMFNVIQNYREASASAGQPWTIAWDEPQKIENDNNDFQNGYPHGRRNKMWPALFSGGDGFMWYIQKDGGGHGFDQRIEDFTIMQNALNWSRYIREFLSPLPLLQMNASNTAVNVANGDAFVLKKDGEVYAVFSNSAGTGISLDLSGQSGTFDVTWFNPRTGNYEQGTTTSVQGGSQVDLGSAPNETDQDWAVLVSLSGMGGNLPPSVNAGADQTIALPDTDAALEGTVNDDGLPAGTLTISWRKSSGPGTVTFADASAADTTATFSEAGSYVLELSADDGELLASDTVGITVSDGSTPTTGVTGLTLINADTDQPIDGFDPMPAGATLNLSTLPTTNLNIRANTNPADVNSVTFYLNGAQYQTENVVPYAIAGDSSGDYNAWTPEVGDYELRAVPGTGAELILNFTVVNEVTDLAPTITTTALPDGTEETAYSFTLQADSGDAPLTWNVVSGNLPAGLALDAGTGTIGGTPLAGSAGSYAVTVEVSDADGDADEQTLSLLIEADAPPPSSDGSTNAGDNDDGFNGGSTYSTSQPIDTSGVSYPLDEAVYQSERYGKNLTYTIDGLAPGSEYLLRLHFAEIWRGSGPGVRVFDISINGTLVVDDLDIYSETGGFEIALVKEFAVIANTDGNIVIEMNASKNNAKVSAIEWFATDAGPGPDEPAVDMVGVNAGGGALDPFGADANFSGGNTYATSRSIDLSRTPLPAPEAVYQTERWLPGTLDYSFSDLTPDGYYVVRLHFAEIWATSAGQRQFNVDINGERVLTDYDIYAEVGRDTGVVKEYSVNASAAGEVQVSLSRGSANNPKISAIEILSVNDGEANAAPEILGDSFTIDGTGPVMLDILANDTDTDGPKTLFIDGVTDRYGSLSGTVEIVDNQVLYTPPFDGFGFDVFDYSVSDGLHTVAEIVVYVYEE